MRNFTVRWIQLQPRERPEPYDWKFILKECATLAGILLTAGLVIGAIVALAV